VTGGASVVHGKSEPWLVQDKFYLYQAYVIVLFRYFFYFRLSGEKGVRSTSQEDMNSRLIALFDLK